MGRVARRPQVGVVGLGEGMVPCYSAACQRGLRKEERRLRGEGGCRDGRQDRRRCGATGVEGSEPLKAGAVGGFCAQWLVSVTHCLVNGADRGAGFFASKDTRGRSFEPRYRGARGDVLGPQQGAEWMSGKPGESHVIQYRKGMTAGV